MVVEITEMIEMIFFGRDCPATPARGLGGQ